MKIPVELHIKIYISYDVYNKYMTVCNYTRNFTRIILSYEIACDIGSFSFHVEFDNHEDSYRNLHFIWNFTWNILSEISCEWAVSCVVQKTTRHYVDIIMSAMASQITGVSIVGSSVCSGADQRKHQSYARTNPCPYVHWTILVLGLNWQGSFSPHYITYCPWFWYHDHAYMRWYHN